MFADDILGLAVLQSLIHEGLVPAPDYDAIKAANPYDREDFPEYDEEYEDEEDFQDACSYEEMNTGVLVDLVSYMEEHPAQVERLTELYWHVPAEVMHVCWNYWDGESDEFELTSLTGIGRCTSLKRIDIGSLHAPIDLSPLTELPALAEIKIGSPRGVKDWAPLLEIPQLRTIEARIDDSVAAQLIAKGVTVHKH